MQDVQHLLRQSKTVTVTAEVECYLQNIIVFLRLHRAVDGGITPRATQYFGTLIKSVCHHQSCSSTRLQFSLPDALHHYTDWSSSRPRWSTWPLERSTLIGLC